MFIQIPFVKAEALSNDFVIADIPQPFSKSLSYLSTKIADRKKGVGCDQVIWIEDFEKRSIRFFNQDGSESNTCLNGTRACALFFSKSNQVSIKTRNGIIDCFIEQNNEEKKTYVTAKVPLKYDIKELENSNNCLYNPIFIDIGNPHIIYFPKEDLDAVELYKTNTVNLSFASFCKENEIYLKVFERGVGFTDSCGSGALATVIASSYLGKNIDKVIQKGGELYFKHDSKHMDIKGSASIVYSGNIAIDISSLFQKAKVTNVFFDQNKTKIEADFGTIKTATVDQKIEQNIIGKKITGYVDSDDTFVIFGKNTDNSLEIDYEV